MAGTVIFLTRGVAHASAPSAAAETPFVTSPPTGPELSAAAIASAAVADARQWGESGEVTVRLAHGTLAQTQALMEGGTVATAAAREAELRSAAPSSTFCFGGANSPCAAGEIQHAKQVLYEESQRRTYLVAMTGKDFSPPESLPHGRAGTTGGIVVLILDAHSGVQLGLSIGGTMSTPKLSELAGASRYIAGAGSNVARAVGKPRTSRPYAKTTKPEPGGPKPNYGSLGGSARRAVQVVVLARHRRFTQAPVRHGRFRISSLFKGTYQVAGRLPSGRLCPAKQVTVVPRRESRVHLTC
jgi:hypothetical protein